MPFGQRAGRLSEVKERHDCGLGWLSALHVARHVRTWGAPALKWLFGTMAVLLVSLAVGSAAAGWDRTGFVQNVGQVSGGCRYYLNTPEYRLEVHPQELRIWLKEREEYPGLKDSEVHEKPGLVHLAGYFLRVPLTTGSGQTVIEAAEPTGAELRVIKGDRHCRRAGGPRLPPPLPLRLPPRVRAFRFPRFLPSR